MGGNGSAARDWITGKILPLILWSLLLASELTALTRKIGLLRLTGASEELTLEVARHFLTIAFFLLVLAAYVTRMRAVSAAQGFRERVLPMLVFLAGPAGIVVLNWIDAPPRFHVPRAAVSLSVAGLALSLWSLFHLRSAFSILAEARRVVRSGPYRFIRHPLYLGEAVTMLGLCLGFGTFTAILFWAAVNGFQLVRARIEEEKLARALPEYHSYRQSTRFILPGLY